MNRLLIVILLLCVFLLAGSTAFSADDALANQFYKEGKDFNKQKNYHAAVKSFTSAIELKPDYYDAFLQRGYAHEKLDSIKHAMRDYNSAIQLKPEMSVGYQFRGFINMVKLKEYDLAIQEYNKAIELHPSYAPYYYFRGMARQWQGDLNGAAHDFEQALVIDPNHKSAREKLANLKKVMRP